MEHSGCLAVCWALTGNPGANPGEDFTGLSGILDSPSLGCMQTIGKLASESLCNTSHSAVGVVYMEIGLQRRVV